LARRLTRPAFSGRLVVTLAAGFASRRLAGTHARHIAIGPPEQAQVDVFSGEDVWLLSRRVDDFNDSRLRWREDERVVRRRVREYYIVSDDVTISIDVSGHANESDSILGDEILVVSDE